ncbi:MAG: 2-oxoacid:acceptor oxidoreductase family protein [Candidatus Korarchaeota archaeon]|nr:2-oxoacid:acceptor oxidoreductase family protein [Candidatus Korarchaeota archaeon]
MRIEVMISGFGGQGVVLSGAVLSQASVLSNYYAAATYTYGPEARLGSTRSEVVISDEEIDYPKIISPDYWVAMNQMSLNTFSKRYPLDKTIILADSSMIKYFDPVEGKVRVIYKIPATDEAERLGNRLVANMLMLGVFVTVSGIIPLENLKEAIRRMVKPQFIDLNLKAVDRGKEIGESLLKGVKV